MNISIRNEAPADYRTVEKLTREAFWGNIDHPTCDGEHLLVHKLKDLPCFVPELDFVAEAEGKIVGHIIYSLAKVITPHGREIEVLNFDQLPPQAKQAFAEHGIKFVSQLQRFSGAELLANFCLFLCASS